jgi:hypothetical protein
MSIGKTNHCATLSYVGFDKNGFPAKLIYNFELRELSYLLPSSACSATVRSGSFSGIILRGEVPGTTEYLEKSV